MNTRVQSSALEALESVLLSKLSGPQLHENQSVCSGSGTFLFYEKHHSPQHCYIVLYNQYSTMLLLIHDSKLEVVELSAMYIHQNILQLV